MHAIGLAFVLSSVGIASPGAAVPPPPPDPILLIETEWARRSEELRACSSSLGNSVVGDALVRFTCRGRRCRVDRVRATPGVSAGAVACVKAVARQTAATVEVEVEVEVEGEGQLDVTAPIGTPRPLLPPLDQLIARWPEQPTPRPGRSAAVDTFIPAAVRFEANRCLSIPASPNLSASMKLWLDTAGIEVPWVLARAFHTAFPVSPPQTLTTYFWIEGRWVLGLVAAERFRLCLRPVTPADVAKVEAAVATIGTCWKGGVESLVRRPEVAFPTKRHYHGVSVSRDRSCAIVGEGSSGEVACCGAALTLTPRGTYRSVSAGVRGICALRSTGEIDCWDEDGTPARGRAGPFVAMDAASGDVCAIDGQGQLSCWPERQDLAPPSGRFKKVTTGGLWFHALDTEGRVVSWSPGAITRQPGTFTDLAASDCQACGLRADGSLQCWIPSAHYRLPVRSDIAPSPSAVTSAAA